MNILKNKKMLLSTVVIGFSSSAVALAETMVQGFGNDIPLSYAVEQIVPDNYLVTYGKGVDSTKVVSWRGGDNWKSVLSLVAQEYYLTVSYDQDNIIIRKNINAGKETPRGFDIVPYGDSNFEATIRKDSYADDIMGNEPGFIFGDSDPHVESPQEVENVPDSFDIVDYEKKSPQEVKNVPDSFDIVDYEEKNAVEPTTPPLPNSIYIGVDDPSNYIPPEETWEVFSGTNLENLLMDWGEEAGWKVVWNSDYTYPIVADAEFKGEFLYVASKLIRSMSNASPPVRGEFYKGNKVLVVNTILDGQS